MAGSDFDLTGRVRIDTSDLDGLSSRIGGSFKGMAAAAATALAAVGIGSLLKDAVSEAREAEKIGRLTENVIRSTGGAAKVTSQQVGDLAESLSNYAGVDDDVIQGGANLLLTFKGVKNEVGKGNDIFNQATKAALDLSATFGTDLNGAALLVGKALDNPAVGLSKLTKMGVTFTEQQKQQVKAMVESGNVMGAQKVILAELASQTGGAAAAAADPFQRFVVVVDNLKEKVGLALLPTLNTLIVALADKLPPIINGVIGAFKTMADVVEPYVSTAFSAIKNIASGDLSGAGLDIAALFGLEGDAGKQITGAMVQIRDGIVAVVDFVKTNGPKVAEFFNTTILPAVEKIGGFIAGNLIPIIGGIGAAFATAGVAAIIGAISTAVTALVATLAAVTWPVGLIVVAVGALVAQLIYAYQNFEVFRTVVDTVIGFVVEQFGHLVAFAQENLPAFQEAVGHVFAAIQFIIGTFVEQAMIFWRLFGDDLIKVGSGAFNMVRGIVEIVVAVIAGTIKFFLAIINGDWDKAFDAIEETTRKIFDGVKRIFSGAIDFITGIFGGLYQVLKTAATEAFSAITDVTTGIADKMFNFGKDIVTGIIDGVKSMGSWLGDQFRKLVIDPLPQIVKTTLGISSPSKVFAGLGREIPAGLVQGIRGGASDVRTATASMLSVPAVGSPGGFATSAGTSAAGITIGDIHIYGASEPDDPRWATELTQAIAAGVGRR